MAVAEGTTAIGTLVGVGGFVSATGFKMEPSGLLVKISGNNKMAPKPIIAITAMTRNIAVKTFKKLNPRLFFIFFSTFSSYNVSFGDLKANLTKLIFLCPRTGR